jgi:hypothetical protein
MPSKEAVATMAFSFRSRCTVLPAALCGIPLLASSSSVLRAAPEPSVARGVEYLRSRAVELQVEEMGLAVLAMLKADVSATVPTVTACLAKLRERFSGEGYRAEGNSQATRKIRRGDRTGRSSGRSQETGWATVEVGEGHSTVDAG